MAHSHSHTHLPEHHTFNIAFAAAIILNFGFTVIEAIYARHAHSASLLADAGHNLGDVLGLTLAWAANWMLTLPASQRYSYGFKRTTILSALFNALLLVITSVIIAYESIAKLLAPTPMNEMIVMVIAGIGILINGGTALLFIRGASHDLNIKSVVLHLASDALIAMGVVCTGFAVFFTGWLWLDACVGLFIMSTILWGTWGLLRDSVNLMLDAVPHKIDYQGIKMYLSTLPGVTEIHDLHIWGLSTREIALTAHLLMPARVLSNADYQAINADLLEKFHIHHATLQIESDAVCQKICHDF